MKTALKFVKATWMAVVFFENTAMAAMQSTRLFHLSGEEEWLEWLGLSWVLGYLAIMLLSLVYGCMELVNKNSLGWSLVGFAVFLFVLGALTPRY